MASPLAVVISIKTNLRKKKVMRNFFKRNTKKTELVEGYWKQIPFLDKDGYGYAINRDGVVLRLADKFVMEPYPYLEAHGGKRVCIAVDKFFCYIDGPALADVIFEKPGSDSSRHCVYLTGYRHIIK